jgi:hypothetical protein
VAHIMSIKTPVDQQHPKPLVDLDLNSIKRHLVVKISSLPEKNSGAYLPKLETSSDSSYNK